MGGTIAPCGAVVSCKAAVSADCLQAAAPPVRKCKLPHLLTGSYIHRCYCRGGGSSRQAPTVSTCQADGMGCDVSCIASGHISRRSMLLYTSAWLAAVHQLQTARAAVAAVAEADVRSFQQAQSAAADLELKQLQGKGGFQLNYPADWIVAFNRPITGSSGRRAIALVGDFKNFETASVQQLDLSMLGQSGAAILRQHFGMNFVRKIWLPAPADRGPQPRLTAGSFDGQTVVSTLLDEVTTMGSTFEFELVQDSGAVPATGRGLPSVTFEYVLSVCRGQTEEGREGRRRCIGAAGDSIDPISRHLLAAATFKRGKGYLLTASAPVDRWPMAEPRLRSLMQSFQLS